jgi:hypothetical protein
MEEFLPFKIEYIPGKIQPADGLSRRTDPTLPVDAVCMTEKQVFHLQKLDPECKALLCHAKYGLTPGDDKLRALVHRVGADVNIINGLITLPGKEGPKTFAPYALRHTLMQLAHDAPTAGHFSAQKTYQKIMQDWWWPGCRTEVFQYCTNCHICACVNAPPHRKPTPLGKLPTPLAFGDRIHGDLLGPLPSSPTQPNKYLLVLTDSYSKLVQLCPIPNKTTEVVAGAILDSWISNHGVCKTFNSDQGKEFSSKVMAHLCKSMGISHKMSSVAHARSNGLVERFNRTILNYLRKYLDGTNDWCAHLPALRLAYNSTPQSSTGLSPFFAAYTRRCAMPHSFQAAETPTNAANDGIGERLRLLHTTQQQLRLQLSTAFEQQRRQFDRNAVQRIFHPGQRIYIDKAKTGGQFQKFQQPFKGPFVIMEAEGNDNYLIIDEDSGKILSLHADHFKTVPFEHQGWQEPPPPPPPAPIPVIDRRFPTGPRRRPRRRPPPVYEPGVYAAPGDFPEDDQPSPAAPVAAQAAQAEGGADAAVRFLPSPDPSERNFDPSLDSHGAVYDRDGNLTHFNAEERDDENLTHFNTQELESLLGSDQSSPRSPRGSPASPSSPPGRPPTTPEEPGASFLPGSPERQQRGAGPATSTPLRGHRQQERHLSVPGTLARISARLRGLRPDNEGLIHFEYDRRPAGASRRPSDDEGAWRH